MAVVISIGLLAAACSKKGDGSSAATTPPGTAAVTTAPGSTVPPGSGATTTAAATTTSAPAEKPVVGGSLVMSGASEVANPWTPAAMQCDAYCYQRAWSFFDPVAEVGTDLKVHGVLAESITPNADYTEWTIKVRPGISFTDKSPVNAAAIIRNLNDTGSSLLVSKALVDVARNADGTFKTKTLDDMSFIIYMGKNGDPTKPLSWPGFDFYLTGQWGLIGSPAWLDKVKADPAAASKPIGSGPFIVKSYAPRDQMVVTKNPNYWQKDKDGVQLPYLDKITFKVIEDSATAEQALQDGNVDIFSTGNAQVISDFRQTPDEFPMIEQDQYISTGYLLVDLAKKDSAISDQRVRCAMAKAIDRKEIADLVYAGIPVPANGVFSPGQEGHLDDNGFNTDLDVAGAKALIADYLKDHPGPINIRLGHTADRVTAQLSDLIKGYLATIGVNVAVDTVPQDQFITLALLGDKSFYMFTWAQHSGIKADGQNFWWNSASGTKDNALSLNFARINDPKVDSDLSVARSDPDPAKRQAAAEDLNRTFAANCYQIPLLWGPTGIPHKPSLRNLQTMTTPDGATILGIDGEHFLTNVWVKS
jgi:ABC-type transport system substrate-binding protein